VGEHSKIEWTHNTATGLPPASRTSPHSTVPRAERRFFGDKHWNEPLKWNREAERASERRRVFCASMADVFEDRPELVDERLKLWALIDKTRALDWLLLTKRPENMTWMAPPYWSPRWPSNVWAMTTVEDQQRAEERLPVLRAVPAVVRGLSMEPLLGPVVLDLSGISWVIVGGESGHGARPMHPAWVRSLRDQCAEAGTPFFFKQWGEWQNGSGGKPRSRDEIVLTDGRHGPSAAELGWTYDEIDRHGKRWHDFDPTMMSKVGKGAAGRDLDGQTWDQMPEVAR
jgi:protein gp37